MDFGLIAAAAAFSWSSAASWWAIAQMAIGLGAVIFVHELGHFLVAKACGVKCEKFYLGFDAFDIKIGRQVIVPRSLLKWTWGETQYGIGILPLGGYVKMLGQDDNPSNIANERKRSVDSTHEVSAAGLDLESTAVGPLDRSKLDPRSYQAKTVLQRMAIISAGVIMNLIFSVIFATIAFRNGVNYQPPVLGQSTAGGPAFVANVDGYEVVQFNGTNVADSYYTFEQFGLDIALNGADKPIRLTLRRANDPEGATIVKEITPALGVHPMAPDLAAIGVSPAMTTKLGNGAILPEQAIAKATPPLQDQDLIVAIDGEPVKLLSDMKRILASRADRAVRFTVERAAESKNIPPQRFDVTIPPNPMVEVGFAVRAGRIKSVQDGSPADAAGLQVGDKIQTVNGRPLGDPYTLQDRLLEPARNHQSVSLTVLRSGDAGDGESLELNVIPRQPRFGAFHGRDLLAIDSLGIALEITNVVESVASEGPAEKAGLIPGDEITGAVFLLDPEMKQSPFFQGSERLEFVPGLVGWAEVFDAAQVVRPPQPVELHLRRDGKETTVTLTPVISGQWYSAIRGMRPQLLERTYHAPNWWEAIQLGAYQTRRDILTVLTTLKKLVRGELAITNIGGPGTIAAVATSEASQGPSRLLLFLTMLGANLAILNFLPIPILDGGHMMFLAYEGIFRRPVNERVQIILSFLGLFFIVGLMLLAISLDIFRFLF